MTREEQMIEHSWMYQKSMQSVFVDGVIWADANPNWTSVKDKRPPLDTEILCVYPMLQDVVSVGFYTCDAEIDIDINKGLVSHWMLMPNPPEKGEEHD